jgi:hypothetical protein
VVAAPHSKQDPGMMRKTIRQAINPAGRQANSKETACHIWVIQNPCDLIQTVTWNFSVDMDKPKDVAMCSAGTSVHLYRPITLAYDKLITKTTRETSGAIRTSTICDNNLCSRCSLAEMRETWPH